MQLCPLWPYSTMRASRHHSGHGLSRWQRSCALTCTAEALGEQAGQSLAGASHPLGASQAALSSRLLSAVRGELLILQLEFSIVQLTVLLILCKQSMAGMLDLGPVHCVVC